MRKRTGSLGRNCAARPTDRPHLPRRVVCDVLRNDRHLDFELAIRTVLPDATFDRSTAAVNRFAARGQFRCDRTPRINAIVMVCADGRYVTAEALPQDAYGVSSHVSEYRPTPSSFAENAGPRFEGSASDARWSRRSSRCPERSTVDGGSGRTSVAASPVHPATRRTTKTLATARRILISGGLSIPRRCRSATSSRGRCRRGQRASSNTRISPCIPPRVSAANYPHNHHR